MKYYKDSSNNVFAYESDGSQDGFISPDLIKITEKEAISLANPPLTMAELISIAESEKLARIKAASDKIALLSDAVELGMATGEEVNLLKEWKKYRVLLTRVDTSLAPNIDWPTEPNV